MKKWYAIYKCYGYKTLWGGKEYGDIHIFNNRKERGDWIDEQNRLSYPNVVAGIIKSKDRFSIIPKRYWNDKFRIGEYYDRKEIVNHF